MVVAARAALVISGSKLSGRQSWRLLWESSRPLSLGVLAWAAADAVDGPLIIAALGVVVGAIPVSGRPRPAGRMPDHRRLTFKLALTLTFRT